MRNIIKIKNEYGEVVNFLMRCSKLEKKQVRKALKKLYEEKPLGNLPIADLYHNNIMLYTGRVLINNKMETIKGEVIVYNDGETKVGIDAETLEILKGESLKKRVYIV